MTLIRVAHSPDSDDAFMFYALAHELIDTGDYRFEHVLDDIETLNREAFEGTYEVTAVSIHAYAHLDDRYALLGSGASMGDGYGPVLITREPVPIEDLGQLTVAIPGKQVGFVDVQEEERSGFFIAVSRFPGATDGAFDALLFAA